MDYKKEGFPNEIIINYRRDGIPIQYSDIYVTDIGYFPVVNFHWVNRPRGIEEHIICFCTKGKGYVEACGLKKQINRFDYFIIPQNIAHSYYSSVEDPWGLYFIHFSGSKIETFISRKNRIGITLNQSSANVIYNILYNCIYNLKYDHSTKTLLFVNSSTNYIMEVLINQENTNIAYSKSDRIIFDFQNYIESNITNKIGIVDLVNNLNVSQAVLYQVVKSKFGCTPMQYVFNMKVDVAANLLQTTNKKVCVIANEVGFNDQYHFSKKFKQITKMSPLKYRSQKKT